MRISLVERELESQRRRRRRSRRRVKTYDAAISQPWEKPTWRPSKGRTTSRRRQAAPQQGPDDSLYSAAKQLAAKTMQWFTPARWLLAFALAGLLTVLAYASFDRVFYVYEGRIVGARYLEPSLIYETAVVHEQNIFWIRPRAIARNVIGLPGVKAVRVGCALPARVTIEVVERKPVVLWRTSNQSRDWWLDEDGVVLPYQGDPDSPDTIFVVDSSDRQLEEGVQIEPEGLIHSVLQLAEAMPQARLFFFSSDRGLSYRHQADDTEWMVYVGTSDSLQRKIQAVDVITDYLGESGIHPGYVDVRWPERPVYGGAGG